MNSRFGRTPRVPWQPMYARFLAPFFRSAKGRYPPKCDTHHAVRDVRYASTPVVPFAQITALRSTRGERVTSTRSCPSRSIL
jgi:hypothetical protein